MEENKKKEVKIKESVFLKPWVQSLTGILLILILLIIFVFWRILTNQIKIENSFVDAPIISLSSTTSGILDEIYVKIGQEVLPNTEIAKVGNEVIMSKVGGIITTVNNQIGQVFAPGATVVSMINPNDEKIVGKIDENKGLADIKIGQIATFTVDAFGSKRFEGVVSEISPVSDQSGILFSISDKRQTKQFAVKIDFDVKAHPELKQGMSAKITIYKK